ncbi:alpha-amylase family protein [Lutibacter citreus]|uniref:hypothetical protein n=1 Tax=Lutibacter citreus TaxID=2138210 RepID=UPI000DBE3026|nr:hypothetical protein [Lutibacter citreus]
MKNLIIVVGISLFLFACCRNKTEFKTTQKEEEIKAFCLDVNWRIASDKRKENINSFAPPGAWADLDPAEHVAWCKELGANVIQTFAVSCNGYAWYKGGEVPEQPGLKTDFLTEMVKLGHKENMKVFGYFCVGSNTRWGLEHPELSYGTPSRPHIPFTKEYNTFLGESIKEAFELTEMDGFMIDWFWNPTVGLGGPALPTRWLACEQEMYAELMGEPFPGKEQVSDSLELEFNRKAINRCWQHIKRTAKTVKSNGVIWLSCSELTHPEMQNHPLIKEVDWLQNEAGDKESFDIIRTQTGKQTRLITTFSANFFKRNNLKGEEVATYAQKENIGMYCYAGPKSYDYAFPPVEDYISKPLESFTDLDERNIAILARVFNNLPFDK